MKTFVKIIWQTGNLETEAKTFYYSLLKKQPNHTVTGYSTKNLQIDRANRSIDLCVLRNACHELFCVFGNVFQIFIFIREPGRRGNKITGQLKTISHIARKTNLSS